MYSRGIPTHHQSTPRRVNIKSIHSSTRVLSDIKRRQSQSSGVVK
jgi:hypothetical protein